MARPTDLVAGYGGEELIMNREHASSRGLEMEWGRQLADWLKVDVSITHVERTEDSRAEPGYTESPVAADWQGNLSLLATPVKQLTIGLQWHHVGDRAIPSAYLLEYRA